MGEKFFTSKEAAKTVGCSLRQLQYWREKEVVVPTIQGTGTGRSIYYSQSDVVQLAIMEYLLSVGLSFSEASRGLKELIKIDTDYANRETKKRWMLCWDEKKRAAKQIPAGSLLLEEFDRARAIALLDQGQAVIPIWLDTIHQKLEKKLL
ncbi:MAG: MerR family transcriptional regulator [Xenococcaceae cyanobacterium MO_207.B15]|nr:MerR family transcriptional regulator [Xenococcaceae cyanobacterium MO_207.B15]